MAEGICNSIIAADNNLNGYLISSSAGIAAYDGDTASSNSIKVLKEGFGIDISSHRSRMIDDKILRDSDLIFTMTREHKRAIQIKYPELIEKVFTLKEFVKDSEIDKNVNGYDFTLDINDPYGMPVQFYKLCAAEIKETVEKVILKLKKTIFL